MIWHIKYLFRQIDICHIMNLKLAPSISQIWYFQAVQVKFKGGELHV